MDNKELEIRLKQLEDVVGHTYVPNELPGASGSVSLPLLPITWQLSVLIDRINSLEVRLNSKPTLWQSIVGIIDRIKHTRIKFVDKRSECIDWDDNW